MKIKATVFHAFTLRAAAAALLAACAVLTHSATRAELTRAQAIARVKTILRYNADGCRITSTQSVSAVRVKAGWRVTARIRMSASGTSRAETAIWIVSAENHATAQNQLTAEIANGCP
jgi:outer membrane biogenesis lipoprotein LolB